MDNQGIRIAFYTLGCKLNQFESEVMADAFMSAGVSIVPFSDSADIYMINTCTVTSKSEQKARRVIRKVSRDFPGSIIIVTGCYAQLESEAIDKIADNLVIIPQDKKQLLLKAVPFLAGIHLSFEDAASGLKNLIENDSTREESFYSVKKGYLFHSRAFLKIQDGCDNFCRYCRVPLARGRSRSLDPQSVLSNVSEIEKAGYRELVLTGVNISSYKSGGFNLVSLVEKILDSSKDFRLRLSSLEPDCIDSSYLRIIGRERICRHYHLPVQSGSDAVLSAMGRKYNASKITEIVKLLRTPGNDPLISADIITGFPGENDQDFKATCDLVTDSSFSYLHVFPFSPRPGTAAWKMKNPVPERISRERAEILRNLSGELFKKYASAWEGVEIEAVIEGRAEKEGNDWSGITDNYLKLIVSDVPEDRDYTGFVVKAVIEKHRINEGNSFSARFISGQKIN